jgi:hypothetical protein
VNDFNATILQCLGIDHERFTVKFQGLDQRLTGVESPKVVTDLLEAWSNRTASRRSARG